MHANEKRLALAFAILGLILLSVIPSLLPDLHWSPRKQHTQRSAVGNPGQPAEQNSSSNNYQTGSETTQSRKDQFEGEKHLNPSNCYDGEHEGECAARIVQERAAGFNGWLTFAAIGQLFVGVATTVVILLQLGLLRKQTAIADEQRSLSARQTDIADRQQRFVARQTDIQSSQLAVAEDASKIAYTTMVNTIRAFVAYGLFDYSYHARLGNIIQWHFILTLVNNGNTITRRCYTSVSWVCLREELKEHEFAFPDILRPELSAGIEQFASIPAKGGINGPRAMVPINDVWEVFENRAHIYVWGWAEYNDVIEGTDRHRTEFAVELKLTHDPRSTPPSRVGQHISSCSTLDT